MALRWAKNAAADNIFESLSGTTRIKVWPLER